MDKSFEDYGKQVQLTHSISNDNMDFYVKKIEEFSGQKIDWCRCAGRIGVLTIGDVKLVEMALTVLKPLHDFFQNMYVFKNNLGR